MGGPCVAYYNPSTATLEYVYRNRNRWTVDMVDSNRYVGSYASLRVDALGTPYISYYDEENSALRHAHKDGPDWIITTVDDDGEVGRYCSLVLDSEGHSHVCYHDASNASLKIAHFDGSWWTFETVETQVFGGKASSLAIDADDNLHICFDALIGPGYAFHNGDEWCTEIIDGFCHNPYSSAITIDEVGQPHVACSGNAIPYEPILLYAVRENTGWRSVPVDTGGSDVSLALDHEGEPHITYCLENGLRHAYLMNNTWHVEIIEDGATGDESVGWYSSIIFDESGHPLVSYYDQGLLDLKIAYAPTLGGQDPQHLPLDQLQLEIVGSSPCLDVAQMILRTPNEEAVDVSIFDMLGRQVCTIYEGFSRQGSRALSWDCRNSAGRAVPSGAYLCSASTKSQRATVRIVLLR